VQSLEEGRGASRSRIACLAALLPPLPLVLLLLLCALPTPQVVLKVGQAQLLRRQLANVLQFSCRLDANLLYQALTTMDTAVLGDIREHYR